jgi:murein DD-endopeptidase MepM/ murein hydrolase activator NlpD
MASLAFRLPATLLTLALLTASPVSQAQHATRKPAHSPAKPSGPAILNPVILNPAIVESGSPELIQITLPGVTSIEGEWFGHKLQFFPVANNSGPNETQSWYALAGADVEAPAVPTTLRITAHLAGGTIRDLSQNIPIHPARYHTGSLSVAPRFVEPGPEDQKLIAAAVKAKEQAFDSSAGTPLWTGSFIAPVSAQPTDSFGTRRMFNGKLASIHKGMDFRAGTGTPVKAGNAGKVVLAQPLYYEGNCVMVDHGLGLMSISMHLSRIDVKPGQTVAKGQQLGLSGATGRVTGPHLHWAIRWQGAMLDPAKLLRLNLNSLR